MKIPSSHLQVNGVIVYDLGGKKFTVDLKTGSGAVKDGAPSGSSDVTISVSEDDFLQLANGKLNPQQVCETQHGDEGCNTNP
jgi:putative sterol carrier protein